MRVERLPAYEYRRERWKNGLGWTREIARGPAVDGGTPAWWRSDADADAAAAPREDWAWRLSIAEVDRDGAFSAFAGVDRELLLLSGNGMALDFADGERVDLAPPHGRARFAGERALNCRLHDGPTRDFNLMWRRDRIKAQLLHRPLVGSMVFFGEPATLWAVYLLAGHARFKDRAHVDSTAGPVLEAGDSALLAGDGGTRAVLEGGGEVLLVKLQVP